MKTQKITKPKPSVQACAQAMVRYYHAVKKYADKTAGYYPGGPGAKCGYGTYSDPNPKDPGMRGVYQCVGKREYDRNLALQKDAVNAQKKYNQKCSPIFDAIKKLELATCKGPDPALTKQICGSK